MKITVKFEPEAKKPDRPARVPRIAKLMALAIHFDRLIREGKVRDQAEIAELGHVSRPRLTQIMNLLALAPNIQEDILLHSSPTERQLRPVAATICWEKQRQMWSGINTTD